MHYEKQELGWIATAITLVAAAASTIYDYYTQLEAESKVADTQAELNRIAEQKRLVEEELTKRGTSIAEMKKKAENIKLYSLIAAGGAIALGLTLALTRRRKK